MISRFAATVAAVSDVGPRQVNEDRCFAALSPDDGSWVIAVADGLGGHPRGGEAADAAIGTLPARIATPEELQQTFVAAHHRVVDLAPSSTAARFSPRQCPMSTLCVAAWTPDGGLVVGWMGDTLPVLVRWADPDGAEGHTLGGPQRNFDGSLSSCLGYGAVFVAPHSGDGLGLVSLDVDDLAGEWAVVIASDGVWEALIGGPDAEQTWGTEEIGDRFAALSGPPGGPADSVARRLADHADRCGLDDNATIAAAHMAPLRDLDEARSVRCDAVLHE